MEPDFNQLPAEIRSLIVNSVPDPEIYDTCNNPDLSYLCDWNFWRRRAIDKYQVPVCILTWLYLEELGAYRYLEVSTQFQPSLESLASISNGVVSVSMIFKPSFRVQSHKIISNWWNNCFP